MCDCRKRIETGVANQVTPNMPEGSTGLNVSLQGYAMIFSGPVSSKQYMVAEATYKAPTKVSRVMRERKQTFNIIASFCMFCGEKYPTEEAAPATGAQS